MKQKHLFGHYRDPEPSRSANVTFADVALNLPRNDIWTYRVPDELCERVQPGVRVRVPFGRRRQPLVGYVVRVHREPPPVDARPLLETLDEEPLLSERMLELARAVARRYFCSLGQTLEAMLPAGVRLGVGSRRVRILHLVSDPSESASPPRLGPAQKRLLEVLRSQGGVMRETDLLQAAGTSRAPVRKLLKAGLLRAELVTEHPGLAVQPSARPCCSPHELTPAQRQALELILDCLRPCRHEVILLHGVTGSGKTEVYMRAIAEVVRSGRQAIVLVPEISLTPQTHARFAERFGAVALLHSHMTPVERHAAWRQIRSGTVPVIVGARSAVFAPCPKLGLIVVDEEHETSFKQETPPRYHARYVAQLRSRLENVPLVLGSATPSLESWAAAQVGRFRLAVLPRRVGDRPLPDVRIIDMRHEKAHWKQARAISEPLRQAVRQALDDGGQVILFLNRRGFATIVQCRHCGEAVSCRYCATTLVYHRADGELVCHMCDYREPRPERCPACHATALRYIGTGTERLEKELNELFPGAVIARMDADTMRRRGAHQATLEQFRTGEAQILLGTQMVTKGLDFPNVVLVGVIHADVALYLPDFRAAERTFQLITQVAGRTGRGDRAGLVLVQTYRPDHPAIRYAAAHDYVGFAREELAVRRRLRYPPFARLVRIVARSADRNLAAQVADELARSVRKQADRAPDEYRVLGPAPAPLERLKGEYRYHVQVLAWPRSSAVEERQTREGPARQSGFEPTDLVAAAVDCLELPRNVQLAVDVDPVTML